MAGPCPNCGGALDANGLCALLSTFGYVNATPTATERVVVVGSAGGCGLRNAPVAFTAEDAQDAVGPMLVGRGFVYNDASNRWDATGSPNQALFATGAGNAAWQTLPAGGILSALDTGSVDHTILGSVLTSTVITGAPTAGYGRVVGLNGAGNVSGGIRVADENGAVPAGMQTIVDNAAQGLSTIRVPRSYTRIGSAGIGVVGGGTATTATTAMSNPSVAHGQNAFYVVHGQGVFNLSPLSVGGYTLDAILNGGVVAADTSTHQTDAIAGTGTSTLRPTYSHSGIWAFAAGAAWTFAGRWTPALVSGVGGSVSASVRISVKAGSVG